MIELPRTKMTVDEFLVWSEALPAEAGRFELWDGDVVMKRGPAGSMNAERSQHWQAKGAIYRALCRAMDRGGQVGHVAIEGPTVRFASGKAVEPDVLVYMGPRVPRGALEVPNPIIVVEVLSPSTSKHDQSLKLSGYFGIDSVAHYLIVDPDIPHIIHHARGREPGLLETRIVTTPNLRLDPPGLDVDLTEVLSDI